MSDWKGKCTRGVVQRAGDRIISTSAPHAAISVASPFPNGICNSDEAAANAELIAEAFNVLTETNLTPREILAQRDELLAVFENVREYWNRDRNEQAMSDALWHIIETAEEAISRATGEQK